MRVPNIVPNPFNEIVESHLWHVTILPHAKAYFGDRVLPDGPS
jgi:hypothetical protein